MLVAVGMLVNVLMGMGVGGAVGVGVRVAVLVGVDMAVRAVVGMLVIRPARVGMVRVVIVMVVGMPCSCIYSWS